MVPLDSKSVSMLKINIYLRLNIKYDRFHKIKLATDLENYIYWAKICIVNCQVCSLDNFSRQNISRTFISLIVMI